MPFKPKLNSVALCGIIGAALIAGVLYLAFPSPRTTFRENGIIASARADRYRDPKTHQPVIVVLMTGRIPPGQHQWDVQPDDGEQATPVFQGIISTLSMPRRIDPFGLMPTVTVHAHLIQYETYDQIVTFHHVIFQLPYSGDIPPPGPRKPMNPSTPYPATVATPDGIPVTWSAESNEDALSLSGDRDDFDIPVPLTTQPA